MSELNLEIINVGQQDNDGNGDNLKQSQIKANTNFELLKNNFGFDFINIVLGPSDGTQTITQLLIDKINSLQGSSVLILRKTTILSSSYSINEISYNTTWAIKESSGTFGLNNQQISQSNLRKLNTTNQVRFLDPDDLSVVTSISEGINSSSTVLDTSLINIFRRTINNEIRIYIYNPQNGNQQFIGGNNDDVLEIDFEDITNETYDDTDQQNKTHYITLSNVVDLKELILIDNPIENDIAIISNYLNDVVNFRYINNGWQRESTFNVGCGVRVDETNQKFYMIDDDLHAPLGVRYVVTDPFGNGSFQFALMCPNADNITGTFIGTSDESDGLRGYTIGGSVGGRIGIMRVSAVNGFPIIVDIDSGTGVVTFRDVASNNIPSSYFSYTYVESSGTFTINHPDIVVQKNIAPSVTPRSFIPAGRGLLVTDFTNTSIEIKLGAPSTLASFPSFTVYRNGTYIVPIDLMTSSGNYIFTGKTRSTERLYAVALNNDNKMSLDQTFILTEDFTIEFGFKTSVNNSFLLSSTDGSSYIRMGGFNNNEITIAIGGSVYSTNIFVSLNEDHFLRIRRDKDDNIYIKLDNNNEVEVENTSNNFTVNNIGYLIGNSNNIVGYIRNLRLGYEYYNFSEQQGLTGESVYNTVSNQRTFTITQGDLNSPIWLNF